MKTVLDVQCNGSRLPDTLLERILQFTAPRNLGRIHVFARATVIQPWSGNFTAWPGRRLPEVIGRIGNGFPCTVASRRDAMVAWGRIKTRREAAVIVFAHEFRHVWQYRFPNRVRWLSRDAEADANLFAHQKLLAWRVKI